MYHKVSDAIREVDPNHIIFSEHSFDGNTGVASSIERVTLADVVRILYWLMPHMVMIRWRIQKRLLWRQLQE